MSLNKLTALLLGSVSTICLAKADISPMIVNGDKAVNGEFPFMARLMSEEFIGMGKLLFRCGASVIDDQYILTAAHCVYNAAENGYLVVGVGALTDDEFYSAERISAREIYYPDHYIHDSQGAMYHDIAVIKLTVPIQMLSEVSTVQLYSEGTQEEYRTEFTGEINSLFTAIGYGNTTTYADNSDALLKTDVNYVSFTACQNVWSDISYQQICTDGRVGKRLANSTCQGDSGGPLLWKDNNNFNVQVGIVSYGPSTCGDRNLTVQSVFTEVNDYADWIDDVVNGQVQPKQIVTQLPRIKQSNESAGSLSTLSLFGLLAFIGFRYKVV